MTQEAAPAEAPPVASSRSGGRDLGLWILVAAGVGMVLASRAGSLPYPLTETLGFVTGALCVYLVIRENVWNFPIGIANNVFFIVLFTGSKLYGDAGLQVVYILLGLHGWYAWLWGRNAGARLTIRSAGAGLILGLLLALVPATFALQWALKAVGGAAPFLDALTTVLSLGAQYLLNRKYVQNWYFWITADVLYIYLYVSRELQLTAILYAIFLVMCFFGLAAWRRTEREVGPRV